MSWIQSFFQKLKKDGEDEFDEYPLHNDEPREYSPVNANENHKDLDARISYQYPKGNSHPSPMMKKSGDGSLRNRRRERNSEPNLTLTQETILVKHVHQTKPEVKKEQKKQGTNFRGPFHPTEIPSPIFGFNRPKKEDSIVEHELSHFLKREASSPKVNELLPESNIIPASEAVSEAPRDIPNVEVQASLQQDKAEDKWDTAMKVTDREEFTETTAALVLEADNQTAIESEPAAELETESEPEQKEDKVEKVSSTERRSHLPFNVLMLKQDRKQWETKRKQVTEAQMLKPEKQIAVEQQVQKSEKRFAEEQVLVQEKPVSEEQVLKQEKQIAEELVQEPEKQFAEAYVLRQKKQAAEVPIYKQESVSAEWQENRVMTEPVKEVISVQPNTGNYLFPSYDELHPAVAVEMDKGWLLEQEEILNQTLQNFNVGASVVNVTQGPAVTRFEVQPEPGVKVNKITNLSDDIKLSLAAKDIRIEAPIPGKHTIGIEVPNQKSRPVQIREIIENPVFQESASPLTAVLGLDIAGTPIVTDLKKMPHGLIAGATGSGKSVCINSILVSLLFKASPDELKLMLIDPKIVELAPYNRIPHLVTPVITDVKAATAALKWAVDEMERRYELFAHTGVRDIGRFNELATEHKQYSDKLPYIVIIIDELADLMMVSPADVEEAICRIAQKARACGIHLIVATQRPSVDVITGLIKANIPTRIAFSVSSQVDSRTIIDISGAEKLLGRGDMLFLENGSSKPVRLQGTFVSDEEIDHVVAHVRSEQEPNYLFEQEELLKKEVASDNEDELFYDACEFIISQGLASTSSLQRRFKIGYNRAARLMDMLEQSGYITSSNGSKPREVLISQSDLESIIDSSMNASLI